jgi:hypothetical protein
LRVFFLDSWPQLDDNVVLGKYEKQKQWQHADLSKKADKNEDLKGKFILNHLKIYNNLMGSRER